MKTCTIIFCFVFFTTTLLSGDIQKKNEDVKSGDQNNFQKFEETLKHIAEDHKKITAQYDTMNERITKLESTIEQYQNSWNNELKKVKTDVDNLPQLKEETKKELNNVKGEFQSLKEDLKKLKELPSKVSEVQKYKQNVDKLENDLKSMRNEIKELANSSFINVVSVTSSNLLKKITPVIKSIAKKIDVNRFAWFKDHIQWQYLSDFLMENLDYGKYYFSEQLFPAFAKQVVDKYTRFKQFCITSINELHKHEIFKSSLKQSRPYLEKAGVPKQYHVNILDAIVAFGLIIILFITYGVFLLFSALICPKIPKDAEKNDNNTNVSNKAAVDANDNNNVKNNKKNVDADVNVNDNTKIQNNENVKTDDNKNNDNEQNDNKNKTSKKKTNSKNKNK